MHQTRLFYKRGQRQGHSVLKVKCDALQLNDASTY